jgi:hypothetical protein
MLAQGQVASFGCHARTLAVAFATVVALGGCFSDPLVSVSNTTEPSDSESGADTQTEMEAEGESGTDTDADTDTDTGTESETTGPGPDDPIPLASDADDGQIYVNGGRYMWLPSGEDTGAFLGEFPQGSAYAGYFRFAIPAAIPAGATILEARLAIFGTTVYQWDAGNHALEIALQDAPDAPAVEQGNRYPYDGNAESVALLPARVRWPDVGGLSWTVGGVNESPDLAPLIQSLLDAHGGLEAGANLQFWITKPAPLLGESEVGFVEFSDNPTSAASLSLTFE